MTRMIRLLTTLVLALGIAGIGGARLAPAALAQTPPPSLLGESFTAGPPVVLTCGFIGSGSFTYQVHGTAIGPYSGTFTESGSFTLTNGTVTAFHATFTIISPTGTVTGSKTLSPGTAGGNTNCTGVVAMETGTTYTATINCAYQDTGQGGVGLVGTPPASPSGSLAVGTFRETFDTSNGVVPLSQNTQGNDNCQGNENT